MASNLPQFTLRIPQELLDKMHYIAEYNARSCNKEFEMLARIHIQEFENKNGMITEKDLNNLKNE